MKLVLYPIVINIGPLVRKKGRKVRSNAKMVILVSVIVVASVAAIVAYGYANAKQACVASVSQKPVILYINQGNGIVNGSGYTSMLRFASCQGFNTVFFQVYYNGKLLFSPPLLQSFVDQAHNESLRIFFALYLTNDSQSIPTSILNLSEDGVSLDMSTLTAGVQQSLLGTLQQNFHGQTAVTTYDFNTTLRPDLLVFETYQWPQEQAEIQPGIIGSVEALATSSYSQYESEFQYALQHSDGVMVFDYYGLTVKGY